MCGALARSLGSFPDAVQRIVWNDPGSAAHHAAALCDSLRAETGT